MNYTKLFYWITVAENAKIMFAVFIVIFMIISVMTTLCYFANININGQTNTEKENQAMSRKWMWWCYPFMVLFWSLYIFTPSKKNALLIVAGGTTLNYLTNDSTAKQIPHELTSFVLTELKNMAQEAKIELYSGNQKERILEEAKSMTSDQLIEKMKIDTTFAKVVLNR